MSMADLDILVDRDEIAMLIEQAQGTVHEQRLARGRRA